MNAEPTNGKPERKSFFWMRAFIARIAERKVNIALRSMPANKAEGYEILEWCKERLRQYFTMGVIVVTALLAAFGFATVREVIQTAERNLEPQLTQMVEREAAQRVGLLLDTRQTEIDAMIDAFIKDNVERIVQERLESRTQDAVQSVEQSGTAQRERLFQLMTPVYATLESLQNIERTRGSLDTIVKDVTADAGQALFRSEHVAARIGVIEADTLPALRADVTKGLTRVETLEADLTSLSESAGDTAHTAERARDLLNGICTLLLALDMQRLADLARHNAEVPGHFENQIGDSLKRIAGECLRA